MEQGADEALPTLDRNRRRGRCLIFFSGGEAFLRSPEGAYAEEAAGRITEEEADRAAPLDLLVEGFHRREGRRIYLAVEIGGEGWAFGTPGPRFSGEVGGRPRFGYNTQGTAIRPSVERQHP